MKLPKIKSGKLFALGIYQHLLDLPPYRIHILLILGFLTGGVWASDLAPMPQRASWIKEVVSLDAKEETEIKPPKKNESEIKTDGKEEARLLLIEVSKDGKNRMERMVWSDGLANQVWYWDGMLLRNNARAPKGNLIYIDDAASHYGLAGEAPEVLPDFPELLWIHNQGTRRTEEKLKGKTYFHYVEVQDYGEGTVLKRELWVDKETRLPFRFHDYQNGYLYKFDFQAATPLLLPAEFSTYLREFQSKAERERNRMR